MRVVFKKAGTQSERNTRVDPIYVARTTVRKLGSLHRRAEIPFGGELDFGVHGAIKDHYRLNPERELPLPVDYIVAATAG